MTTERPAPLVDLERVGACEGCPSAADMRVRSSAAGADGTSRALPDHMNDDENTTAPTHHADHLWALRDEIRLKIHLAGMEAKDEWRAVERELDELHDRLTNATADVAAQVASTTRKLDAILAQLGQVGI
ncbi:MAG TPA: hypothetical protein VGM56_27450 [Byssovorax sp.]